MNISTGNVHPGRKTHELFGLALAHAIVTVSSKYAHTCPTCDMEAFARKRLFGREVLPARTVSRGVMAFGCSIRHVESFS